MTTDLTRSLTTADWQALRAAYRHLEHPSLAARLTALLGTPIEQGMHLLPGNWESRLRTVLHGTVERSLQLAIMSLRVDTVPAGRGLHAALGAATGAIAGAFGLPALLLELPLSTAIMLRGIATVAAEQGEDLRSAETRAECVKVFAFGGRRSDDDAADTGYYGLRLSLALHFAPRDAAAPSSVALVRNVASRLGVAFSDKTAAQLVPVVGALCGSLVNVVFVRHFYDVAWGHFTIRRLERAYGPALVSDAYRAIAVDTADQGAAAVGA
jgi:hypothetical protein